MKYVFIMIVTIGLLFVACGEQDPGTFIILGPDGKPIDAGNDVKSD